jgi:hypothetical protein
MVEVDGATAQGVVDRQRDLTAPWLGFDLPAAVAPRPPATLEVKQVKVTHMAEGDRYDFEYRWDVSNRAAEIPNLLTVDVIGARDIRVTNMEKNESKAADGSVTGHFSVNTTKATTPADYDLIARGRIKMAGRNEDIYARPLKLTVIEKKVTADASNPQ